MRSLAVLVLVAALLSGCSAQSSKDPEATCWLKHAALSAQNLVMATEWEAEYAKYTKSVWNSPPERPNYKRLPDCEALG